MVEMYDNFIEGIAWHDYMLVTLTLPCDFNKRRISKFLPKLTKAYIERLTKYSLLQTRISPVFAEYIGTRRRIANISINLIVKLVLHLKVIN